MTVKTRSQLGRMSRVKGAQAERDLVAWLRTVGFGGAERAIRTGYRTAIRTAADPGDVTGTPGMVWSVKDVAEVQARKPGTMSRWFDELDAMDGGPNVVRLLVHKRAGHADPGLWWCWLRLWTLLDLDGGHTPGAAWATAPVRMELGHLVPLLRTAGYGDSIEGAA